ncbi:heterokaryon incompatibility protein-domain-containing protein [Fusarium solani]|uniref:Heterokaryon incompatibility protein-domain-containing protein n=1 Tax=Fusarium solani TaxID=169388 RepID=A0A9P9GQ44_FUSSL|nr:heterokaryon incompatibility protein-domain-containing protein [Fusarium solani]KAH7243081.1 heterokaryon incompatibility protein-domain-containing protein [Fusarium solani]
MDNHPTEPLPADAGPCDDPATINECITRARIERFQKSARPRTEEILKDKGYDTSNYNFDDLPEAVHQAREDRFIECVKTLLDLALGEDTALPQASPKDPKKDDEPHVSEESLYSAIPLDISPFCDSVRLLELLPATSSDAPICANMKCPRNFPGLPKYEALSYVRGSPEPVCAITINDHQIMINSNLHDALKYLRRLETSRILWVDQLCINQQDAVEKSHQVARMGDIYRKATDVVIFLGPPTAPLTFFMDALANKRLIDLQDEALDGPGSILQLAVEAVCAFCSNPWWTRLWVQQEFYLANGDPLWFCGDLSARTSQIQEELDRLRKDFLVHRAELEDRGIPDLSLEYAFNNLFPMVLEQLAQRSNSRGPRRPKDNGKGTYQPKARLNILPSMLYAHLDRTTSDPRDYVYGVRDLMGPVFSQTVLPDYSKSAEYAFELLAAWLLLVESWADMFWHYPSRPTSPDDPVTPSWVPDFSRRSHKPVFESTPDNANPGKDPRQISCAIVNRILHIQGQDLGTINSIVLLPADNSLALINELWRFDNQHNDLSTAFARLGLVARQPSSSFYWALDQLTGVNQAGSTRTRLNFQVDVAVLFNILEEEYDKVRRDIDANPLVGESSEDDGESENASLYFRNIRLSGMFTFLRDQALGDFAGSCMFDYANLVSQLQILAFQTTEETEDLAQQLFGIEEAQDESVPEMQPFCLALARQLYNGVHDEEIQDCVVRILRIARVFHEVCQHRWSKLTLEPQATGDEKSVEYDAQVEELTNMARDKLRNLDHVLPKWDQEVNPLQALLDSRKVTCEGRVLFRTSNDKMGLSWPGVEGITVGQRIVMLEGPRFPMIISPTPSPSSDKHRYGKIVGHAMVEGVEASSGEVGSQMEGSPKAKLKMFRIV